MEDKADLHMHTTYSDGVFSTSELVKKAKGAGLQIISITDHDNVGAIDEAMELGSAEGIEVIPGVELSAGVGEHEVHILAYFFDHKNQHLLDYLKFFRIERIRRAERIVEKLNGLNVPLKLDAVLERAGTGSVGRPHIATALFEEGLTDSYHEAFYKYIGNGKPAYEKKYQVSPEAAIELIASAGGLSFIAHPGNAIDEAVLLEFIKEGVDGIEVIHPSPSPERVMHYSGIVNEYFLLASGGSDFHGGRKNDQDILGKYYVSLDHVHEMRRRLS